MSEGQTPQWASPGEGYHFQRIAPCKGCGELMAWWVTPSGKRSPHDRDGASHFATCPQAGRFRKSARAVEPETQRPPQAIAEMRDDDGRLTGWLVPPAGSPLIIEVGKLIDLRGTFTIVGDTDALADYAGKRCALVPLVEARTVSE